MRNEIIKWKVVITTNTFATTFENDLCAFVTGQIGQCNVGTEFRYKADEEVRNLFEAAMERRMCSDDYFRPVYSSLDDSNAFELYFKDKPTDEMMSLLKSGCEDFALERKKKLPITTKIEFRSIKLVKESTVVEVTEEEYLEQTA